MICSGWRKLPLKIIACVICYSRNSNCSWLSSGLMQHLGLADWLVSWLVFCVCLGELRTLKSGRQAGTHTVPPLPLSLSLTHAHICIHTDIHLHIHWNFQSPITSIPYVEKSFNRRGKKSRPWQKWPSDVQFHFVLCRLMAVLSMNCTDVC